MKKAILFFFLAALIGCSKEQIQQQQQNTVVLAMTSGQWKVTSFMKGSTDVTADFATYTFQFKTNMTVDALHNGTVEKTGSWAADATAQTITSNFTGAAHPLDLLNGTFTITNTTWTSVVASQTVGTELRSVRLDKQ